MASPSAAPHIETGKSSNKHGLKPNAKPTETKLTRLQELQESANAEVMELLVEDAKLYGRTIQSILDYANFIKRVKKVLSDSKNYKDLGKTPWMDFQDNCKGGRNAISMLLAIAEYKPDQKPNYIKCLPASISTLNALTDLSADAFGAKIEDGTIFTAMNRDAARALVGKKPQNPLPKGKVKKAEAERAYALKTVEEEEHAAAAAKLDADNAAAENEDYYAALAHNAMMPITCGTPLPAALTLNEQAVAIMSPLTDDGFFHFDLSATKTDANIEMTPSQHNTILKVLSQLKQDLPTIPSYEWHISLVPVA